MDNRKVRRVVKTPDETYISQWYEQHEPYSYNVMLNASVHPQDTIFITIYNDVGMGSINVVKSLPIVVELETGDVVTIPPSIVDKSITICEFEKGRGLWAT